MHHRKLNLVGDEREIEAGLEQIELRRGEVGHAKMAHLARQRRKRLGHFVGRHEGGRPMDEQQIKVVGLQFAERVFGRGDDVIAADGIRFEGVRRPIGGDELDATLADELHLGAQTGAQGQRLAKQPFASVTAVNIGMVEGRNAQFEALFYPTQPFGRVPLPLAKVHRAGDDGGKCRGGHFVIRYWLLVTGYSLIGYWLAPTNTLCSLLIAHYPVCYPKRPRKGKIKGG